MSRPLPVLRRPLRPSRAHALGVAALFVVGCGGKVVLDSGSPTGGTAGAGGGGSGLSCDITEGGIHECETLANGDSADTSSFMSACMSAGGTELDACSDTNRLGTCSVSAGGISVSISYYAGNGLDAASAQQACTSEQGTWTAG
jgi:hypothetical protein